jgi:endonuclease YncB( thermonuclease family)
MNKAVILFPQYNLLLSKVKKTLIEGQARIEAQRVRTYWETGRLIHAHILQNKDRAEYGAEVLDRLARDLNVHVSVLRRCLQFREKYPRIPIHATWREFSWSHYRELMSIPDDKKRRQLEDKASRNKWSVSELAQQIKEEKSQPIKPIGKLATGQLAIPKIGALYTYTTLESPKVFAKPGVRLFDCGFDVWVEGHLKDFPPARVQKKSDYTYRAYIEKVIDADTLWANIDLGFNAFTRQKLRLNGIDAPEIETAAGKRARAFVMKALRGVETVTIVTSKSDKYDRYLADIFIPHKNEEAVYLNNFLLQNGHAGRMD